MTQRLEAPRPAGRSVSRPLVLRWPDTRTDCFPVPCLQDFDRTQIGLFLQLDIKKASSKIEVGCLISRLAYGLDGTGLTCI